MGRKITAYHVWGKPIFKVQREVIQIDTLKKPPEIGKSMTIDGVLCKVLDYAEYQMEDRRSYR